jgi:hypothetical protein
MVTKRHQAKSIPPLSHPQQVDDGFPQHLLHILDTAPPPSEAHTRQLQTKHRTHKSVHVSCETNNQRTG